MVALLAVRPARPVKGSQVRAWRLSRLDGATGLPMTQVEAATYYGVTDRSWSRWENGAPVPGWLAQVIHTDAVPPGYRRQKGVR
jgi:DNA-binding transcriptional regulator YiaG